MPRVHLAKSLHILHHLTTHHRGTGSQCRGSLRSSLGDHWKALQVQLGTSSRIFCNFAFVSYCFTPDLLETLQKTAIKRCQLSQLRVFVVCPEHANMFNILRKPQNISKWFSFTSPELCAWNYLTYTYSIRFLPQTSLRNWSSTSYKVSATYMDWFFQVSRLFSDASSSSPCESEPPGSLERSWNPWKCRSTPVGIWSPSR